MHRQHVCPNCLTRTHSELLAHPEVINVRPGTLDTPATVAPFSPNLDQPRAAMGFASEYPAL
jgi:hypothetical protein